MHTVDLAVFRWLNAWAGASPFLDWLILLNANYTLWMLFALGGITGLCMVLPRSRHLYERYAKPLILAACAAFFGRFIITETIRFLHKRARPFEMLPDARALFDNTSSGSFPSGHAALSFAIATAISLYFPKAGGILFLIALFMGAARVTAGVHWPSDILGGAVVGILSAFLVRYILNKIKSVKKTAD